MRAKVSWTSVVAVLIAILGYPATPGVVEGYQSGPPAEREVIVDNSAAEVTGAWTPSTYKANYYGSNYLHIRSGTGANRIVWRPDVALNGSFAVYYRLPNGAPDRAPNASRASR